MSVWRDVQEAGSNSLSGWLGIARGRVKVMGADETVVRVKGKPTVVGAVGSLWTWSVGFVMDRSSGVWWWSCARSGEA